MSLFGLLAVLIVVGAGLYLVNSVLPIDAKIKTIINVVTVVLVLLWVVDAFVDLGAVHAPAFRRHVTMGRNAPTAT